MQSFVGHVVDLERKLAAVWPISDERTRGIMAASEAMAMGFGGVSVVRRACGPSRKVIAKGIEEIRNGSVLTPGRVRREGAGRKAITSSDPSRLDLDALDRLVAPETRGDPESPLRSVRVRAGRREEEDVVRWVRREREPSDDLPTTVQQDLGALRRQGVRSWNARGRSRSSRFSRKDSEGSDENALMLSAPTCRGPGRGRPRRVRRRRRGRRGSSRRSLFAPSPRRSSTGARRGHRSASA